MITLALSKGRILDDTLPLLARIGIGVDPTDLASRRLILPTADHVNEGTSDTGVVVKEEDFTLSREEMIEELRGRGVKVDGRWSDARVAAAYQAADEQPEGDE